jgi:hypothetical protein
MPVREVRANRAMIVDRAVDHRRHGAVARVERLSAAGSIDDRQSLEDEADVFPQHDSAVVGPSMMEGASHRCKKRRRRFGDERTPVQIDVPG